MTRLSLPSALLVLATLLLLVVGCSRHRGTTYSDGLTFDELMEGVVADPADYELEVSECVATSEHSIDDSVSYSINVTVTNADDRLRTFEVWTSRYGERWSQLPLEWLEPGESDEVRVFLGWQDEIPEGCPEHQVEVYRNPVEALFGEEV